MTGWRKLPLHAADAARTTSCAAAGLSVLVDAHPLVAAGVIRRQVELGRLTELDIAFSPACWHAGEGLLLKYALQVGGLRELHIGSSTHTHTHTTGWSTPVAPSLKKLAYGGDNAVLLKVLLRAHAATLEVVRLDHLGGWDREVTDLLSSITHPWELQCHVVRGLGPKLAECRSLTSLRLTVQDDDLLLMKDATNAISFVRQSHITRLYVRGRNKLPMFLVRMSGDDGTPISKSKLTHVEVDMRDSPLIEGTHYELQRGLFMVLGSFLPALEVCIFNGELCPLILRD
ncbi:hypothetical protein FOCC_FOCC011823 [Frankliniella occidentalis]|nr:hypothetical protein FOCC_FOCC011823 [Frankliniella occidentalis]